MYQYIETIKVLDGEVKNLPCHQARFERTRSEMLGFKSHPQLEDEILVPKRAGKGLFKCRILYDHSEVRVEFHPYIKPEITSLKLVSSDQISYTYKSADRSALSALFKQRGSKDDILIIKKGRITDSSFANVVLWDGCRWLTPEKPLLEGCMRASLLKAGVIDTADIQLNNLSRYKSLRLINALNDWSDAPQLALEAISW
jgi:4-amino-4-deoxychorismate lyase